MAGTITRLVYQQRNQQRVNVYLDGEYAFALPDAEAARLHIGQHLSDSDIARLRQVDEDARAFDKAARFLGHRPRSQAEVDAYLQGAGFAPEVCARASERLRNLGYLDDAAFVQWWLENRSQFHPLGPMALRQELRQKGVSPALIDEALAALTPAEQALAAAETRATRWRQFPRQDFYKKMLSFLQRRGFDYNTSRTVTDQVWKHLHDEALPEPD